jgi:FXSXX-COOH protein
MSERERRGAAERGGAPSPDAGGAEGALPDLLDLDLETLRTLDHPVLTEVLRELRGRADQPREMLWGFSNDKSSHPPIPEAE